MKKFKSIVSRQMREVNELASYLSGSVQGLQSSTCRASVDSDRLSTRDMHKLWIHVKQVQRSAERTCFEMDSRIHKALKARANECPKMVKVKNPMYYEEYWQKCRRQISKHSSYCSRHQRKS